MRLERSFVFVRTIVWTRIFRRRCSPGRFGCLGVRPARRLRNFTVRRILKIPKFVARAKRLESNSTRRKRFLSEARPRRREIPYRRKKKDARAERRKNDDDDDRARARLFYDALRILVFVARRDSIRIKISLPCRL